MNSFDELADFYDLDYQDSSDHVFLKQVVRAVEPRHLLEIPCGSGRNILPLLEAAQRRVTFMDLAETMVRQAGTRIPVRDRERARAVVGDLRSLGVINEFDLVICPREAFQLLPRSEAAQALRSMAASITSDGLIVIDLFNFSHQQASDSDSPPDYFKPSNSGWVNDWTRTTDDGLSVTRLRRQSRTADGVHFEMRYTLHRPGACPPHFVSMEFEMTNYSNRGFSELAGQCHLGVLAVLGGYGGTATTPAKSLREVFILGSDRCQETGKRWDRISEVITADRPVA
jgi:SAM-dependent methyltransferase